MPLMAAILPEAEQRSRTGGARRVSGRILDGCASGGHVLGWKFTPTAARKFSADMRRSMRLTYRDCDRVQCNSTNCDMHNRQLAALTKKGGNDQRSRSCAEP